MAGRLTAVADVGRFLKACAGFFFKGGADLVALMAGTALTVTDEELVTYVGPAAAVTVDAEVMGIIEAPPVPCV